MCIWLTALGVSTMSFNLNRTNLKMKVMHKRNVHNFSLDLTVTESGFSIALGPLLTPFSAPYVVCGVT